MNYPSFPKTVWFLWLQGRNQTPEVARKCYESWKKHNPDWNIIFLDKNNICDYLDINITQYTPVVLSEILRINLLAKYGGVWADATCYCSRPLNDWLFDYLENGFFAFERPGPDRMISSWFIASYKDNYITLQYQKAVNKYWKENPKVKLIDSTRLAWLHKYLARYDTSIWFSPFVAKILKVHPYFWFHYTFRQVYLADKRFKQIWDSAPKISADIPIKPQAVGLLNTLDPAIKAEIDNKVSPVYKLTWKYNQAANIKGSVFDYILHLGG